MTNQPSQDQQDRAIQRFADWRYESELSRHRKERPEKLAEIERTNPSAFPEFRETCRQLAVDYAHRILDPDSLIAWFAQGGLHPSNRNYRRLFSDLTGVSLPSTVRGTREAVREYLGPERFDRYYSDREAARHAKRETARAEQARADESHTAEILENLKTGQPITGDELVTAARFLSIPIPARTVGTLRRRVSSIQPNSASQRGRRALPISVWDLYRQVRSTLNPQE